MTKAVQLSPTAHEWLRRHQFLSEEVILSVVLHCPTNERKYTDSNHFQIDLGEEKTEDSLKSPYGYTTGQQSTTWEKCTPKEPKQKRLGCGLWIQIWLS